MRRGRNPHRRQDEGARVEGQEEADRVHRHPEAARDKDIDAISIATPNHWHTLQTIWACQAGKDVYVEKPCSHNIFESQQIVAAARKYNRIVQQGSQSRSSPALQRSRAERCGTARSATSTWRAASASSGATPSARRRSSAVPPGVDYDLWLGPAPLRAVHQEPLPLQLALVLGHRQRRPRQPGHPRDGHRALGPGRDAPDEGQRHRRQVHVRRRPGDAEHDHAPRTSSTTTARRR